MSLLANLKSYQYQKQGIIKPSSDNIDYLTSSKVKEIVGKGLSELYKIQPKNPITFLSNWLKNESDSIEIINDIKQKKKTKEEIQQKIMAEQKIKEEQKKIEDQKNLEIQKQKEDLENSITTCEDFEDHLNEICEKFKNIINATGVYISKYDLKKKFPIDKDADETGHIDPENIKVLNYLYYCNDHSFLHRKYLEPDTGVTYNLIKPKENEEEENDAGDKQNDEDNEEENEKEEKPKEEVLKSIYIPEVILEPSMKFFKEPRLGCYFAIDIRYQSSMQFSSLESAINNLKEYKEKKEEQDRRREEKESEKAKDDEGNEEKEDENEEDEGNNNEEGGEVKKSEENEKTEDDAPAVLKEFDKVEQIYILSVDTMGQDREFTEEENKYIMYIAKLIRDSMTNREVKLLEKDRDLRIDYLNVETPIRDEFDSDKIASDQDIALKDYASSDDFLNKGITDEEEKEVDFECFKAKTIINNIIYGTELINLLKKIELFEFVEYEKIFQNIFYFAKIPGVDINETDTHKLSWKKGRKIWTSILDNIKDYDPIGPKPEEIPDEFKGNVILDNLETFIEKEEEVSNFSFALMKLVQYIIDILKVRKSDIIRRHKVKSQLLKERNDIIQKNKDLAEDRKNALAEAKEEFDKEHPIEEEEEEEDEEEEKEGSKEKEEGEEGGEEAASNEKEEGDEGNEENNNAESGGEEGENDANEEGGQEGEEANNEEGKEGAEEGEEGNDQKSGGDGGDEGQEGSPEEGEDNGEEGKEENNEEEKEGNGEEGGEEAEKSGEEGNEGSQGSEKKKKKKKKEKKPRPVFNEEEFLEKYDEEAEHKPLEVPEEVVFDIDKDFDINFEDEDGEEEKEEEGGNEPEEES